jgi:hypothetical protein
MDMSALLDKLQTLGLLDRVSEVRAGDCVVAFGDSDRKKQPPSAAELEQREAEAHRIDDETLFGSAG